MSDIFSRNLVEHRPYKAPKALHYHVRPERGTVEDETGTWKTARAALNHCPDGYEVVPCPFNHADIR